MASFTCVVLQTGEPFTWVTKAPRSLRRVSLRFLLSFAALDLGAMAVTHACLVRESSATVMPQLSVLQGEGMVPTKVEAKGQTWKDGSDAETSTTASFEDSLSSVFNKKCTLGGSSFNGRSECPPSKRPWVAILTLLVPQSHQRKFPVVWGMQPRKIPFLAFDLNLAERWPTDLTHTLQPQTFKLAPIFFAVGS